MIVLEDGCLSVSGAMTMATAAALLEEGRRLVSKAVNRVDLGAVGEADSCGLAVLLEWARVKGQPLALRGVPASLQALAALYDLDGVLGLTTPQAS